MKKVDLNNGKKLEIKNELFDISVNNDDIKLKKEIKLDTEPKTKNLNVNLKISDTLTFENDDDETIKKFIKKFIEEETENDNMTLIINEYIENELQGLNYSEKKLKELLFAHRYSNNLKRIKITNNAIYMNNGACYDNNILNASFKNFSEGNNPKKTDIKFGKFGFPFEAYIPNISLKKEKDWFKLTIYENNRNFQNIKDAALSGILNMDLSDKSIEDMFKIEKGYNGSNNIAIKILFEINQIKKMKLLRNDKYYFEFYTLEDKKELLSFLFNIIKSVLEARQKEDTMIDDILNQI